jgi:hypothetical protein
MSCFTTSGEVKVAKAKPRNGRGIYRSRISHFGSSFRASASKKCFRVALVVFSWSFPIKSFD